LRERVIPLPALKEGIMAIPSITIQLDKPRRLRLGMGVSVAFEQLTGINLFTFQKELSATLCCQLLWMMFKEEDPELTLEQTARLIDDNADNLGSILKSLPQALRAAQGVKIEEEEDPNAEAPIVEEPAKK